MPVHIGIMCDRCRKVHFIATSPGIEFGPPGGATSRLRCKSPCAEARVFRKDEMRPYRVSDEAFRKGYAEEGEYEPLPGTWNAGTHADPKASYGWRHLEVGIQIVQPPGPSRAVLQKFDTNRIFDR